MFFIFYLIKRLWIQIKGCDSNLFLLIGTVIEIIKKNSILVSNEKRSMHYSVVFLHIILEFSYTLFYGLPSYYLGVFLHIILGSSFVV